MPENGFEGRGNGLESEDYHAAAMPTAGCSTTGDAATTHRRSHQHGQPEGWKKLPQTHAVEAQPEGSAKFFEG